MSAETLIQKMTDTDDQSSLCVVLRPGEAGLEVALVADEIGRWSIPGGHAKDGESRADACKREVKEETGMDVEPEPLLLADHAARKLPVTLFFATVEPNTEAKPGGGDVTKVQWTKVTELGDLNGTDKLAIQIAANRIHNVDGIVDDAVQVAEDLGFAVATVSAPPAPINGIYFRINGKAASSYAQRLSEWAGDLGWPTAVIVSEPCETTKDALKRASKNRRLTPTLECLLQTADALWRYESAVAPVLLQGGVAIEIGPQIDPQRLLEHGLEPDLWENVNARIPRPTILFTVGKDFNPAEFKCLKDAIEQTKKTS